MTTGQKSINRKKLLWPLAAIIIGALVSVNPFYAPRLSLAAGITAWFVDMAVVLIFLAHPITVRPAILISGFFFAVPCFLWTAPLSRGLLMCCMAFPFSIATAPLFAPSMTDVRTRWTYFFTWMGTREIARRTRSFDSMSLLRLTTGTVVFAAALGCLKAISATGFWLAVRWLAGGVMIFAFAEMATASHDFVTAALMRSPFLSTSVGEFWTRRWNIAASTLGFRPLIFAPLARSGVVLALFAAFFASAVAHTLLAYMAIGRWKVSLACGAFFLVQPVLILCERRIKVRRWPRAAARVWTLAALAISSPLFVEPMVEIAAPSWNATDNVLPATIFVLGFALILSAFFSTGQLASSPGFAPTSSALGPT